jgi:DNA polymerase
MSKPLTARSKIRVISDRQLARYIERRVRYIHLDYETFCELDLKKVGLDVYSAHPSCRILMAAYRINGGKLKQWFPRIDPEPPAELVEALTNRRVKRWAFNAQFERVITKRVLGLKTPRKGWRCSQVLSYMHCFAGGLEEVGAAMGLPIDKQKSKNGKRLIKIFCLPNKITKNQPHRIRDWETDPGLWQEFCEYNRQDVISEEAILHRLNPKRYPIPEFEWKMYELDQLINDRGIPIDMDFVDNIIRMSAERKKLLLARMAKLTGCKNPNSVAQLSLWLRLMGYDASDLRADTVKKVLKRYEKKELYLPKDCVKVLKLRQFASLTSVTKAKTAKLVVGEGNCIRYMLQFGGASRTLRWAGRKVQSQNMKRTPKLLDAERSDAKLSYVTDLIREGNMAGLELAVPEPMTALSGCMRSMFRCPEGEEFKTADLKSIESAVIAWLTQCKRLLKVFADNRDPYRDFGMEFYKKAYDAITSEERNICKPPALGCGFRMGPGKELDNGKKTGLIGYAENMGIDMEIEDAERAVGVFRKIYFEIERHWYKYEKAIRRVMATGKPVKVGPVTFERNRPYLTILLPSGRRIYYFKPKIEKKRIVTKRWKWVNGKRVRDSYIRLVFTHMGKDNTPTGRNIWRRIESHGGVIIENIVQAIARDVLCIGLMRAHKVGFRLVGHAHDEAIARGRIGENRLTWQYLCDILKQAIDWASGLPLGAAGWGGAFYRKV